LPHKTNSVEKDKIIIALDGHSSCGKSTFAKRIAGELGYAYIDTGAMYRAVTLAYMEAGLFETTDAPDEELVISLLDHIELDLRFNPELQRTEIYLNNRMVEDTIRTMAVSAHVSYIAAISAVRRKMVEYQRKLGQAKGVVMDGRDIGTVVFPKAELKIFLTASLEVRAERRYKELIQKGMEADLRQVSENLQKRDHIDSNRQDSPLKQADDALVLDNSSMTVDQQMEWFREKYESVTNRQRNED
jgi:cytidylate kinase